VEYLSFVVRFPIRLPLTYQITIKQKASRTFKAFTSRTPGAASLANPRADHEPGGGLLGDRNRECGAG